MDPWTENELVTPKKEAPKFIGGILTKVLTTAWLLASLLSLLWYWHLLTTLTLSITFTYMLSGVYFLALKHNRENTVRLRVSFAVLIVFSVLSYIV